MTKGWREQFNTPLRLDILAIQSDTYYCVSPGLSSGPLTCCLTDTSPGTPHWTGHVQSSSQSGSLPASYGPYLVAMVSGRKKKLYWYLCTHTCACSHSIRTHTTRKKKQIRSNDLQTFYGNRVFTIYQLSPHCWKREGWGLKDVGESVVRP